MSTFPNFADLSFDAAAIPAVPALGKPWETPEGISVKTAYGPDDVQGLTDTGYPGLAPFTRGPYPTMYLTNPWTFHRLRSGHPSGL